MIELADPYTNIQVKPFLPRLGTLGLLPFFTPSFFLLLVVALFLALFSSLLLYPSPVDGVSNKYVTINCLMLIGPE